MTPFPELISSMLEARGISKYALAKKLGLNIATICYMCDGKRKTSTEVLDLVLREGLGIPRGSKAYIDAITAWLFSAFDMESNRCEAIRKSLSRHRASNAHNAEEQTFLEHYRVLTAKQRKALDAALSKPKTKNLILSICEAITQH